MKSTRRGFLGLLGGGAVAGPGALKGAIAKASTFEAVGAVTGSSLGAATIGVELKGEGDWLAYEILNLMRGRHAPATLPKHYDDRYADIEALKSVSMVNRCRMQRERKMEAELSHALREFVKGKKLNWIGLNEDDLLSMIKQAAGEKD